MSDPQEPHDSTGPGTHCPPLTRELLRGRAALAAAGEAEAPGGLPPDDEAFFAGEVRRLRRARLLAFLARLIARSLHEDRASPVPPPGAGGSPERPPVAARTHRRKPHAKAED